MSLYIDSGTPKVTYTNIEGSWPGTGNIDQDPLFIDAPAGDYHLSQDPCQSGVTNPCVDGGSNLAFNLGLTNTSTRSDGQGDLGVGDLGAHYGTVGMIHLKTNAYELPVSSGGSIQLAISCGSSRADANYLILGSLSGTQPGIPLPGGLATLPINWDRFTELVLRKLNTSVFSGFMGSLDLRGEAAASINTGALSPSKIGTVMHFAFCLQGVPDWNFVSNPIEIRFVP